MISSRRVDLLYCLFENDNVEIYKQLLQKCFGNLFFASNQPRVFIQHNASCHKEKKVTNYLLKEEIRIMDWQAQSSNLNLIKKVWKTIVERA